MTRLQVLRGGTADASGRRGAALLQAASDGLVVAVAPGHFVDTERWTAATAAERHVARMEAVLARAHPRLVVADASAAAVHGLPWIGEFPTYVTVIDPSRATGQRRPGLLKIAGFGREIDHEPLGRRAVTTLSATGVDVALRHPVRTSVVLLDALLARGGPDKVELLERLGERRVRPGSSRALDAITFADHRSGSVGESIARVVMDELGAPQPTLQQAFQDERGLIGVVDFWFPEQGAIIEFDGRVKYTDPRYRSGRSATEVVVDEKIREDRLRAKRPVHTMTRIVWADVTSTERMTAALDHARLPRTPRRFRTIR